MIKSRPYNTIVDQIIEGHKRLHETIQGHRTTQGHTRPQRATQGQTRPCFATKDNTMPIAPKAKLLYEQFLFPYIFYLFVSLDRNGLTKLGNCSFLEYLTMKLLKL